MKILVLNCGSSSIKYKLFDMSSQSVMAQGGIEKIGLKDSFIKIKLPDGEKVTIEENFPEHTRGIEFIFNLLTKGQYAVISSISDIDAVGHRVVHGGEKFNKSVLIDEKVIAQIVECSDLAPLHNPANLLGINAVSKVAPKMPQVAVFDTAFHQTMPSKAFMYAIPYEYYEKYGVRRYGFHGTSHRYVSKRACDILGVDYTKQRIITAHIGNGGSIAAIKDGQCIDTTMGLTPLEGLVMGTRSGDIDAGAVTYLMDKEHLGTKEISNVLNKKSGMVGLSGISDMRDLTAAKDTDARAKMTFDVYNYRIKKYIGAYAAALNGFDILVFTGGVGENQSPNRKAICEGLDYLGLKFDEAKNETIHGDEAIISTPDSKITVMVVPTDEELMIASDTLALLS